MNKAMGMKKAVRRRGILQSGWNIFQDSERNKLVGVLGGGSPAGISSVESWLRI